MNLYSCFISFVVVIFATFNSLSAQPRYDYSAIKGEVLGRGVVAFSDKDSVTVTWRYLSEDPLETGFNVYCNDVKLNNKLLTETTFYRCPRPTIDEKLVYEVRTVDNGVESGRKNGKFTIDGNSKENYLSIKLDKPANGVTPDGRTYTYHANDASVGDVDGDGEFEIVLKWDPSNSHDNAHDGYTGNVIFDCYRLTGEKLWRIDLGKNIRAGAHYTQFMVFDLDGDGKTEVVMKTADGTVDGIGVCIGDSTADYRHSARNSNKVWGQEMGKPVRAVGRILTGPEFLTVFDGATGKALHTVDYVPVRGDIEKWGDSYANRSDRYLACVAYLDGVHASVVMCRGYYTRSVLAAWDWDGKQLKKRWVFDTDDEKWHFYAGQGNHNLRVADVDGDGFDEITYGSMAVDHDGTGLYNTGMGHGDAIHQYAFFPDSEKLQIWDVHENKKDGSDFRDAASGEVIYKIPSNSDVGRGMAADVDPRNYGLEMWSIASGGIRNIKGELVAEIGRIPVNSAVWWDGDLLREMLDASAILKYNYENGECYTLLNFKPECSFNNGTKNNPCLSADILGDWREEVIVRTIDSNELRIFITTMPTRYRFHTFMEDIPYRISVATQNVAYNQPPEPGFYFGSDLKKGVVYRGCVIK